MVTDKGQEKLVDLPKTCRHENQAYRESPPAEDVAEWADEEQAGSVAGLRDGRDGGRLFVGDVEVMSENVQDRVGVVEICHLISCQVLRETGDG